MRQSQLFTKTFRESPKDEPSINAQLLVRAGYVDKLAAGIYSYLPLGLKVLDSIKGIVREEMRGVGGQEILMPALHPKEPWATTGRWTDPGPAVMFQLTGRSQAEFGLGWTHEEIVTPLAKRFISSYRDLPFAVFQIQDKFRNEPRAKSGLLRGREFSMKDLYSFHRDRADLEAYYAKVSEAYSRIFTRCGVDAVLTEASGGAFSKYSHEFQVLTEHGEDIIYHCSTCGYAQNKEIFEGKAGSACAKCKTGAMQEQKAIEVGNIFMLGTRFSAAFDLTYLDERGESKPVEMGCYGIGPSRVLGTVVEVHHDSAGIIWPKNIAPYVVHLLVLGKEAEVIARAQRLYEQLQQAGVSALFDDRPAVNAGEKFATADLLGMPLRAVVSARTGDQIELRERASKATSLVKLEALVKAALA